LEAMGVGDVNSTDVVKKKYFFDLDSNIASIDLGMFSVVDGMFSDQTQNLFCVSENFCDSF
jgi:hypothetical protein